VIGASEVDHADEEARIGARPVRILVVEDDESTRLLLVKVLTDDGFDVTAVADGGEAAPLLGAREYDLLLTDVDMPEMDGFELTEVASKEQPPVPVLMLTGSTDGSDEARALGLGVVDFVRKPIRRDVLLMRVRRALGDRG
jgi:CheY-like chemotaxis protein